MGRVAMKFSMPGPPNDSGPTLLTAESPLDCTQMVTGRLPAPCANANTDLLAAACRVTSEVIGTVATSSI